MKKLLPLFILSFIFGFLLTLLLSSSFKARSSVPLERKRNLIRTIKSLEKEREDLKSDLKELREKVKKIEEEAAKEEGFFKAYQSELNEVKAAVGLQEAEGPGLIIYVSDNPNPPPGEDLNNYIVHDYDLRIVINALFRGGAEAISINNQRIVFTSSLRCVGTTILCNAVRLAPPYEIKAVGNPAKMSEILSKDRDTNSFINNLVPQYGLIFKIKEAENIVIPGYSGSISIREAEVYEK